MTTIEIEIFTIDELSCKAAEKASSKWLESVEYFWGDEDKESLQSFADIFPIQVKSWTYGDRETQITWNFTEVEEIEELTGWRLAAYIWNNYKHDLYNGKYYSLWSKKDKNPHYTEKGSAPWGQLITRHSKIILVDRSCPFTGYTADESLLDPIWKFMDNPDDTTTFYNLIEECLNSWLSQCNEDYEYTFSEEAFKQECENNNWHFDESGRKIDE